MFCRTRKVEKMIKELKDEIKELKDEVEKAKEGQTIPYGEAVVPVYLGMYSYMERNTLPLSKAVEMLLAHSGMEIVKEPKKDEQIMMKKKLKVKKPS